MVLILLRLVVSLLVVSFITTAYAVTPTIETKGVKSKGITNEDVNLRIDTFDEMDRVFKALRFKVVNQRSTNREGALEFSGQLVKLSYRLPALFDLPSSREVFPQSRSRPEIWSQKARFDHLLNEFVDNLEQIDDQIKAGNLTQAGRLIDATAKGCRRCHNAFRYR